jgi:hypothetical protein
MDTLTQRQDTFSETSTGEKNNGYAPGKQKGYNGESAWLTRTRAYYMFSSTLQSYICESRAPSLHM